MWYLMSVDDGIVETGETKRDIMANHNKAERSHYAMNKAVYHVLDECYSYYLYRSKEQAIADGFDWAFEDI